MAKSSHTKKTSKRKGIFMIIIVLLVLIGVISYNSVRMQARIAQKNEEIESLEEQIDEQEQLADELIAESEYMNTDAYVEEVARDKLGLVGEDDIVLQKSEDEGVGTDEDADAGDAEEESTVQEQ